MFCRCVVSAGVAARFNWCGSDALLEMVSWEFVEFAYERSVRPPLETISVAWHEILIDAIASRQQETAIKSQRRSA